MSDIMKMIPGLSRALPKDFQIPEKDFKRVEAIICSMTRARAPRPRSPERVAPQAHRAWARARKSPT